MNDIQNNNSEMVNHSQAKDPLGAAATIDNVLRREKNWQDLFFYQKTVVLRPRTAK